MSKEVRGAEERKRKVKDEGVCEEEGKQGDGGW